MKIAAPRRTAVAIAPVATIAQIGLPFFPS
jgi:hypothetical protein